MHSNNEEPSTLTRRYQFFVVAIFLLALVSPARGSLTVTNCTEVDLQAAVNRGGLVTLACDGTIILTAPLIVSTNLTLDAAGHTITISGGNSNRLFEVRPGMNLTLRALTLVNGANGSTNAPSGLSATGGAILIDRGAVILEDCTLASNRVLGSSGAQGANALFGNGGEGQEGGHGQGGAIFNNGGIVLVNRTTFFANAAAAGSGGAGGSGSLSGNGSHGGDAGAGGAALGAAIFNTANGTVQLFDSTFASNRVTGAAGGIGGTAGGALGFPGANGESGMGGGAAIYNQNGRVTVNNCTFVANACVGAKGLAGSAGTGSRDGEKGMTGSSALGAALFNDGGALSVTNTTFFGNVLVGGNGGSGGAGGGNGFGGDGGNGGSGGQANGGGIFNEGNGTATIVNCTFSSNSAVGGTGGAAGAGGGFSGRRGKPGADGLGSGASVFNAAGTLVLQNTILAYAAKGGNCGGTSTDGGNNLSSDMTCQFSLSGSFNNVNPMLSALADNGGLTQTAALLTNSPAINAGNDLVSPARDQRHAKRTGRVDMGAFEFNGTLPEYQLEARRGTTNSVVLAWPVSNSGLVLETTDTLSPQALWTLVTNQSAVVLNQKTVTLNPTDQIRYFRLRKP